MKTVLSKTTVATSVSVYEITSTFLSLVNLGPTSKKYCIYNKYSIPFKGYRFRR